ncbi:YeeE/YedE family protein [Flavobacterium sp. MFBS3-15]|uniref:YeeE/YedE family protein n=1 Tax=Flavobacterium sp. MFBS3-15 TaxID=2989816 RepID=UPI002235EBD3|nr:YeeE/YedE family protein [Flavobacterium sp. MFBS3-15]MCW4468901.1 YeeE/YedE family protein [Flavobacterium sp. MFBS3-15]
MKNLLFLLIGTFFGIVMFKSEAASWFRIYEMFQFKSFHMYGIIGSALVLGLIIVQVIKRRELNHIGGSAIEFVPKERSFSRYMYGGILFGLGWALAGACPGPMFTLLGAGFLPILIVIAGALAGTWAYGLLRNKLPH